MRSFFLVLLNLWLAVGMEAQEVRNLEPLWERSLGSRQHTNRDPSGFTLSNFQNEMWLVGSVERDSSFSDLLIEKHNAAGDSVWQVRYSSGRHKDYDTPLQAFLASDNALYVFGQTATGNDTYGTLFLIKINAAGILEWDIHFEDITVTHDFVHYFDAFLAAENFILCTFTCLTYNYYPLNPPTYFMSITPSGSVFITSQVTGIGQPTDQGVYGLNVYHHGGAFHFLLRDFDVYNQYYLRRIHPLIGTDTTYTVNSDALTTAEKIHLQLIDWSVLRVGANGDVYTATNFTASTPIEYFAVLRMSPTGVLRYLKSSKTITPKARFDDLQVRDTTLYLTGQYQAIGSVRGYVWKLDAQGAPAGSTDLAANGQVKPVRMYWGSNANLFITALQSQKAWVLNLNTQLEQTWSYQLHLPTGYNFNPTTVLPFSDGSITASGTLHALKYPTSLQVSEEDIYFERFLPGIDTPVVQHSITELGTSFVFDAGYSVHRNGDLSVFTRELTGPEPGAQQTLYKTYRLDSIGQVLWSHTSSFVPEVIPLEAVEDASGHTFLPVTHGSWHFSLIKLDQFGALVGSVVLPGGARRLMRTSDGTLWVLHETDHFWLSAVDSMLSTVQTYPLNGLPSYMGKDSDALVTICTDNDSMSWGVPARFTVYRNGIPAWHYTAGSQQTVAQVAQNPASGQVVALLHHPGWMNYQLVALDAFGSQLAATPVDTLYNGDLHPQNNGNWYSTPGTGRVRLFNAGLQLIAEHPIPITGLGQFQNAGEALIFHHTDTLHIFGKDGAYVSKNHIPYLNWYGVYTYAHPSGDLYIRTFEGQQLGGGFWLGWRWQRALLAKFRHADWAVPTKTQPAPPEAKLSCYPNPTADKVYLEFSNVPSHQSVRLSIWNSAGKMVSEQTTTTDGPVELSCAHLSAGWYVVLAEFDGKRTTGRFAVMR